MDKSRQTVGFFLVHSIDCGIGGMESHQKAFIDYFFNEDCDSIVKFKYIIENNKNIYTICKHTIFRLDAHYSQPYLCAVTFNNNDYGKRKSKLSGGI